MRSTHNGAGSQCVEYVRPTRAGINGQNLAFKLPHAASHMAVNAGTALTMLATANWPVEASTLETCVLPGRAQVVSQRPWIIVDGAHTQASLQALGKTLQQWPARKRYFVVCATRSKSVAALATLIRDADGVWVTCADPQRSMPAAQLAALLNTEIPGFCAQVHEQPDAAFAHASANLGKESLLCICGSVYLAGAALRYWQVNTDQ